MGASILLLDETGLPAYAPDLNPAEWLWSHTKCGDLANFVPDDVLALEIEAGFSLWKTRRRPTLLHSFFQGAGLKMWLDYVRFSTSSIAKWSSSKR